MDILYFATSTYFLLSFQRFQALRVAAIFFFTTASGKRIKNMEKISLGKLGMKYISMQCNISVIIFFLITDLSSRTKFRHAICKPDFPKYWAHNSSHKFLQVAKFLVLLSIKTHMSLSKKIFGNLASHIFFEKFYSLAECMTGWCSLDFMHCKGLNNQIIAKWEVNTNL